MAELIDYPDGKNPFTGEPETQPVIVLSENDDDGTITGVAFDSSGASRVVSFLPESVKEEREAAAKKKADDEAAAAAAAEQQREQDAADLAEFRREKAAREAAATGGQADPTQGGTVADNNISGNADAGTTTQPNGV